MNEIPPCYANQTRIDPAGVVIEGEGDPSRRAPVGGARAARIGGDAGLRRVCGGDIAGEEENAGYI